MRVGTAGTGTMVGAAVPASDTVPAGLVTVQLRATIPAAPAVKVMLVEPVTAVMVPPVMLQS